MNSQTRRVLSQIGAQIPKELLNKLIKTVPSDQKRQIESILENPKVPASIKRKLQRAYDAGIFNKGTTEIDENVQAEIDTFIDKKVKQVMRSGKVEKADPRKDPFLRRMQKVMR